MIIIAAMKKETLKGKVVIITGASSGIGRALTLEMHRRGAHVVIGARSADKIRELEDQYTEETRRIVSLKTDVSVPAECQALVSKARDVFGRVDVLVNNAGISMRSLFRDTELGVIRKLMETNFWGTVNCTKFALPYLLESKGIVAGVSSIGGFKGLPGRTGYSASKFAIHGFLETLRIENLKNGLHVLIACPGFTASNIRNTALDGKGRMQGESPRDEAGMMPAEEVARHISDAIEKRKRSLVLTTQGKMTVLMNRFFPAWLDKIVYKHFAKEEDSPLK